MDQSEKMTFVCFEDNDGEKIYGTIDDLKDDSKSKKMNEEDSIKTALFKKTNMNINNLQWATINKRYFYFVNYSYSNGEGMMELSLDREVESYDQVLEMTKYLNELNNKDTVIRHWRKLEKPSESMIRTMLKEHAS